MKKKKVWKCGARASNGLSLDVWTRFFPLNRTHKKNVLMINSSSFLALVKKNHLKWNHQRLSHPNLNFSIFFMLLKFCLLAFERAREH